jgi:hypothetical protein
MFRRKEIRRDVPGPAPAAPDGQELSAEERAYRIMHAPGIAAALQEYGDPTRYLHWNEEDVRRNWPELWQAWTQAMHAEGRLYRHGANVMARMGVTPDESVLG